MQKLLKNHRILRKVVLGLYQGARLTQRIRPHRSGAFPQKVVHVSPCYFDNYSIIGGGERYAQSLARAMANHVETVFVSFGNRRYSFYQEQLRVEVYPTIDLIHGVNFNPLCYNFLQELISADVVHCHQYWTVVSNLAVLTGAALCKRVFVTDYGGWGHHFVDELPLSDFVNGFLPISYFSAQTFPQEVNKRVIYGGVDNHFKKEGKAERREEKVLFVGRLLPHKGINYLIEAMDEDVQLDVIGRPYDEKYFSFLKELGKGKQVRFLTNASDKEVINAYQTAMVTILPSVYVDMNGMNYKAPELLGLVLLESMACGTPVICTNVGAMPEIVENGVTGFVVPPNDPVALRERIRWFIENPDQTQRMGQQARERVFKKFTWDVVAQQCLIAYVTE